MTDAVDPVYYEAENDVSRETPTTGVTVVEPHPASQRLVGDVSRETNGTESFDLGVPRETSVDQSVGPDVSRETSEWTLPPELANNPFASEAAQAVQMHNSRSDVWPAPPSGQRIIAIANQKGGVGKTTSTVNLAAALALHGLRVLVVDLDPQGNASTALGVTHPSGTPSTYDILVGEATLAEVIVAVDAVNGLFCAPATIDLAGAEVELASLEDREYRLREALQALNTHGRQNDGPQNDGPQDDGAQDDGAQDDGAQDDGAQDDGAQDDYDYIFIDCPPSLGQLTVNGLVGARELLLPIQCEFYALEGLAQLLSTVDLVRSHLNPGLEISAVLLTMYDARTRLADQVADEVRRHFGDLVLPGSIPRGVRVSEAPGFGQTVMTYDPGSRGALAYLKAAKHLAKGRPGAGAAKATAAQPGTSEED